MRMQPRPTKPYEQWTKAPRPGTAIAASPTESGYVG